jgi:hypothetical protein
MVLAEPSKYLETNLKDKTVDTEELSVIHTPIVAHTITAMIASSIRST